MNKGRKSLSFTPSFLPNKRELIVIKKAVKFVFDVLKGIIEDNIGAYSAHVAFFVTISFIPAIMLLISLLQYLPFTRAELTAQLITVFPQAAREFVSSFVDEAYQKSGATLISVSAASALWASSIGVYALVCGLNRVFRAENSRGYIKMRIISVFYTFFILVMLVLCLGIFVFGNTIIELLEGALPKITDAALVVMSARKLAGMIILSLFFWIMFAVITKRKTRVLLQLPGAVVSAAGWVIFSYVFSYYYEHMANYSYIYGSLSVLVFFMLWLFFCVYILFIGAEINRCIQERAETASIFARARR